MGSGYDGVVTLSPRVTVPADPKPSPPALRRLVHEHLLVRSEGLPPASLAAFIAGWGSALQLLRRGHAELPWVSAQQQRWVGDLIDAVEDAAKAELEDE